MSAEEPLGPVEPVVRRSRRAEIDRHRRRKRRLVALVAATLVLLGGIAVALQLGSVDRVDAIDASTAGAQPVDSRAPTTAAPTTAPPTTVPPAPTTPPDELLPDSGAGRRVVFSVGRQRMWWVDDAGAVLRTALVSGRPNTPQVGRFQVYSKTLHATGLDGSKMDYFVRFTKGPAGWSIGFHDIPEMDGAAVQTVEQLGQPLSHGCIRQREEDATFTWDFLQVGDTVVVVA